MLANSRGIWFAHRNSRGASEFESANMSDLDRQIEKLKRCETLKESEVKALCLKAMEILVEEGNVQRVDAPVIVSIEELVLTIPPPLLCVRMGSVASIVWALHIEMCHQWVQYGWIEWPMLDLSRLFLEFGFEFYWGVLLEYMHIVTRYSNLKIPEYGELRLVSHFHLIEKLDYKSN